MSLKPSNSEKNLMLPVSDPPHGTEEKERLIRGDEKLFRGSSMTKRGAYAALSYMACAGTRNRIWIRCLVPVAFQLLFRSISAVFAFFYAYCFLRIKFSDEDVFLLVLLFLKNLAWFVFVLSNWFNVCDILCFELLDVQFCYWLWSVEELVLKNELVFLFGFLYSWWCSVVCLIDDWEPTLWCWLLFNFVLLEVSYHLCSAVGFVQQSSAIFL